MLCINLILNLLSSRNVMLKVVLFNFNSLMNLYIHIFYLTSCLNAMYSASVVDINIIYYFFNIHAVTSSFNINT